MSNNKEISFRDVEFDMNVEILQETYDKVMYWIDKSDVEVSGLGKVEYIEETNTLRVIDAILLPQKNSSTTTDLDAAAVGKAMYNLRETPGELKWWWHSHVNMNVFWSGTDIDTIKQLGMGGWFVSTVFNKKREMKTCYSQKEPIRLIYDNINTQVITIHDEDKLSAWEKEYDENVTKHEKKWELEKKHSIVPVQKKRNGIDDEDLTDEEIANWMRHCDIHGREYQYSLLDEDETTDV